MSDIVISVKNISKYYQVFDKPISRVIHSFFHMYEKGMTDLCALNDVSFDIKRGESVAIIGRNGGGKSTLLQILTGTLKPSSGEVAVNGRVSALLELGSGFNPEYSGRDNVMLNGLLLGLSKRQILDRFHEIEAFAEIGDAVDRPVKTYSSGMMMRLAFAVQVLCDPEILIIDEALSVGDFFFQQKCLRYITSLSEKGVTLLFVSHDMGAVRDICKRALYVKKGSLVADGGVAGIIGRYLQDGHHASDQPNPNTIKAFDQIVSKQPFEKYFWKADSQNGYNNGQLIAVDVFDANRQQSTNFNVGDKVRFEIAYLCDLNSPCHAALSLLNKYGQVSTITGSYFTQSELPKRHNVVDELQVVICEVEVQLMLEVGQYSFDVSIGLTTGANEGRLLDEVRNLGPLTLSWDYDNLPAQFLGMCGLPVECKCYLKQA